MKTKSVLLMVITLYLTICGVGCKEKDVYISDLYHTWKFQGFVNTTNNSFEKAVPTDCESCYVLTFDRNDNFFGFTASNSFFGEYQINSTKLKINSYTSTKVFEAGNGEKYAQAIPLIESYEIVKGKLKLYYNQGKNHLLFNLVN